MDPFSLAGIFIIVGIAVLTERYSAHIDIAALQRNAFVAVIGLLLLTLLGWLFYRHRADRAAEAAYVAANPTADVVALRFAFDASAAPKIWRDLKVASRRPLNERLRAVTERLIQAQLDYRLVGTESTRPLPETAAAELFFFWSDGARQRYVAPKPSSADGLIVVCLHVETTEEIPDLDDADPKSVLLTLETLRDHPRTVRRVDLWASRQPIAESALRELDTKLMPARG